VRLTKLELQGFKSFADHTTLVFEPGVTAVVGPNGCGKSNVSDAVRWVLGEQRAKTLRGAKMEEVIFQGSSSRRPVNIAEVSLHFENEDGSLPVPFKEVVITRRLSRSGESEYMLNGAACRLRDIHDMVRGTGLGADSGVVIEARMIDALLSDRPDDRRELFEEAAGVGLYRDRRRTTARRLEETTVDLSRLDDLISEVQSQVRSLARQRKKAERHGELMARRFVAEITLVAREMESWQTELASLELQVTSLRETLPLAEQRVHEVESEREMAYGARTAAEAGRTELSRLVSEQRANAMTLEGELKVAEERQRNALARRERADAERRSGEELGNRLAEDRNSVAQERLQLEGELAGARETLGARTSTEEGARAAVTSARQASEQHERRTRELRDEGRRLELDRESAEREQRELAQRAEQLGADREQIAEAVKAAADELHLARRHMEETEAAAAQMAASVTAARSGADQARARESAARSERLRAEELWTSLQGKVHGLEALERERVGLAPAAAQLLKDRDQFGEGAVLGPLSDFVSTGAASAQAVERFLGNTVHAILVRDRATANAIREWHTRVNPGPLLLLPMDAPQHDPSEAGTLAELVETAEPAKSWIRNLLGHVKQEADGTAFVDARGAVWLPGSAPGAGPLLRRAELTEARASLERADAARAGLAREADAARAMLQLAEAEVTKAIEAASIAQQSVRRAAEQRDEIERRRQRAAREVEQLDTQHERVKARQQELIARLSDVERRRGESADALERAEGELAGTGTQLAELQRAQELARDERGTAQVIEAQLMARLQNAADRERRLQAEVATAGTRLEALQAELTDIEQADRELAQHMATWRMDLDARAAALTDAQRRLDDAERGVHEADVALREIEHAGDAAHQRAHSLTDSLHHAELRFTELSGRRTAIRERLEAEWRRPLEEMLAAVPPAMVDEPVLRSEVAQLRAELENIGPVNALAIEEHEEESKRLDFLTTQRADLIDAKNSLHQAIKEIDATARELFLTTFTQVREHFRQIFMTLFGGGDCDLRLENPDIPLDCDIEIHASPRGKLTQRIHLLSSGERALVALSLLFGIFLTKPSPFCLLDEVDAPLDDQNIGRFVRMLNRFKDKTQFIVITHNPRTTTEAADSVYGVTMQEPGVSSFVSVRMRGAAVEEADREIPVTV
jgi:chromosome segregation protein